jgi:hypothetical protein
VSFVASKGPLATGRALVPLKKPHLWLYLHGLAKPHGERGPVRPMQLKTWDVCGELFDGGSGCRRWRGRRRGRYRCRRDDRDDKGNQAARAVDKKTLQLNDALQDPYLWQVMESVDGLRNTREVKNGAEYVTRRALDRSRTFL